MKRLLLEIINWKYFAIPRPFPSRPWKKKYIWKVFKNADTPQWRKYFDFAKPILGIETWGQTATAKADKAKSAFDISESDIIFDLVEKFQASSSVNNMECEVRDVLRAAGWLVPAVFQHPPIEGTGSLIYRLQIPSLTKKQRITLIFETLLAADNKDGVSLQIQVNDKIVFESWQKSREPKAHNVDLSGYAGKNIELRMMVNKNITLDNDWFYWVNPLIIYE